MVEGDRGHSFERPDKLQAMGAVRIMPSRPVILQVALEAHKVELVEDPIVHAHLSELYDTLLEQNLCRLIEPFSRVEIQHIADLINLPHKDVEAKLSLVCLPYFPMHIFLPFGWRRLLPYYPFVSDIRSLPCFFSKILI